MSGDTGLLSPGEHCEAAGLQPNLLTCRNPRKSLACKELCDTQKTFFCNGSVQQLICLIQIMNLNLDTPGDWYKVFPLERGI